MTKNKKTRNSLLLLLTAFIWGTAFVAQSTGGDAVGPFSFCCIRSFVATLVLIPVIMLLDRLGLTSNIPKTREDYKLLVKSGICCGLCLGFASIFQQCGINYGTPAGKAGFLTACYIVLVPILGLFIKKKCGINVWIAVAITLVGLYLLCINDRLSFQTSDILVIICSLIYAMHILTIDHFTEHVDAVRMSCIQFLVAAIIAMIPMLIFDVAGNPTGVTGWASTFSSAAWGSILYAAVLSSGVAYTLQCVGQQGVNPAVASLIMSLESVFSVLAGWVVLHEVLSPKELFGCALIFGAVILAQLQIPSSKCNIDD